MILPTLAFTAALFSTHQLVTSTTPAGRFLAAGLLLVSAGGLVGVLA